MAITIKYLASLAEELNKSDDTINPSSPMTVDQIWQQLNPEKAIKTNTVCSVNFEYATRTSVVSDGAEVAFFPPVTGG